MKLKAAQAATRIQHGGLATSAVLDLRDPQVLDYYAFVGKYRQRRADFIPGSRLLGAATGYKRPAQGALVDIMLNGGAGSPRHAWRSLDGCRWILTTLRSVLS